MFEASTRLKQITHSLLLLSPADAGRLSAHPEPYATSASASHITITNTGTAISGENLQRLFERFFRGDHAHNRKTDGFGLGLNIGTELAGANGAELPLLNSRDDETVFEVVMAMAEVG